MLFVLDLDLQEISMHTFSEVKFMGAINAVWSSMDGDCIIETPELIRLARNIAWKSLFNGEPTLANILFACDYYRDNWRATVQDSILQAWDFNWRALLARPAAFGAFLVVAVALRTYVYEKEVITWAMTSLHPECLALISIHVMSDHKWKRCSDEIKKALPAVTFPTVTELRQEGPLMRGFLIKTTGQVGDFLICGSRQADPGQFPYLSNTYCRDVRGGLVAIDVIADTLRRVSYPQFWEYRQIG